MATLKSDNLGVPFLSLGKAKSLQPSPKKYSYP